MAIDQLQDLVREYASEMISYAGFRQRFVADFLAGDASEPAIDVCNRIEALCSDAEHGLIPESRLKARLAGVVLPQQFPSLQELDFHADYVDGENQSSVNNLQFAFAGQ